MKNIKKYLFILSIALTEISVAQDFHLSMYDAAPVFLNPAMTGLIDSKMRAHIHFRNQWNALAYKPFTTALASYEVPKGKWGFGGQISNMRAGIGNYNVLQLLGSASYAVPIDKKKYHNFSLGMQLGFTQKRVEYKALNYDSQWTTQNGGTFNRGLSNNENFDRGVQYQEAVNFGLLYFYGKQQTRLNPFIGFSGFNLTTPKETFFGSNNRLPRRYYLHSGIRVNVSELFYLTPKILIYAQKNIRQQTYAIDAGYYFKGEKFYALAGFIYRPLDANIVYIGLKKETTIIKIAYDFNVSTLRNISKTRGAYEISITWMGKSNKGDQIKNCPRL
jgi:type IX secretion system PorP/SprF family membrane protein